MVLLETVEDEGVWVGKDEGVWVDKGDEGEGWHL